MTNLSLSLLSTQELGPGTLTLKSDGIRILKDLMHINNIKENVTYPLQHAAIIK